MTDKLNPDKPQGKSNAERLDAVHTRAMRRFDAIWSVERHQRAQMLFDRRFATIRGAQWEGIRGDRDEDDAEDTGSPRMEIPKFLRSIRRMLGEYRSSRRTVDFRPRGEDSDRASADNLDGLYRADENDTVGGGQAAYDNAFQEAIKGGMGAWRYRADDEDDTDEDNEHQRIRIEAIYDADQSVFFDLDAKAQDKSDARHGFILFTLTREAFEDRYPDHSPTTFSEKLAWQYDWISGDTLTLAEYFEVDDRSVLRRTFRQTALDEALEDVDERDRERTYDDEDLKAPLDPGDEDSLTLEASLKAQGWKEVRSRRIRRPIVRKYLMSGAECLKPEGVIAGPRIPVVPLYAERSYVDGVEVAQGMVRPVIDPTVAYNVMITQLVDGASSPADPVPIVAPEQYVGQIADIWATRKTKHPALLPLIPIYDDEGKILQAGASEWLQPTQVQPNVAALIQLAGNDIGELMGANDRPDSVPANTSAEAIELVNDRGDINDFLWQDNFATALACGGRIWLGMAKELYVEGGRRMVSVDAEGKQSIITLAEARMGDGGAFKANDLTSGAYDVIVDVGPASKTRRDATVRAMLGVANAYTANGNADNANAALGVAVINMDAEGVDGFRSFVRKQGLNGGWVEPNEQEAAELQAAAENAQPDPAQMMAMAQQLIAQAEMVKAQANQQTAEARVISAQAQARKADADAQRALASIDRDDAKQIVDEVKAETESDRKDREQALNVAEATTRFEQHDRNMGTGDER